MKTKTSRQQAKKIGKSKKISAKTKNIIQIGFVVLVGLAIGGIIVYTHISADKAANTPTRKLVEQYLQGLRTCDYKLYATASQQALYKDAPWDGTILNESDHKDFLKNCGQFTDTQYLSQRTINKDGATAVTYFYQIKLKQATQLPTSGTKTDTVIAAPSVVGDEKDGYLIIKSPVVLTLTQYQEYIKTH